LFWAQFSFSLPARVNFVGGGGKTTLILKLLTECAERVPAVYTTTTRIHPPHPTPGMVIFSSDSERWLETLLERALFGASAPRAFVVTRLPVAPGLLGGVNPDFANHLAAGLFPVVLNEADGARSMSIKMPREGEPVMMAGAGYLVPVIGIDCLDRPVGPETLFRWEIASTRCGLTAGDILTPEAAASILLHKQGVCRGWRPGMQVIPFINKVDTAALENRAKSLARALLSHSGFPLTRIVWGSLHSGRIGAVDR